MNEKEISLACEDRLQQMYERMDEWPEEEYDPYAEAEARWECLNER